MSGCSLLWVDDAWREAAPSDQREPLVEDRKMLEEILRRSGHDVRTRACHDPVEAHVLIEDRTVRFDGVILDYRYDTAGPGNSEFAFPSLVDCVVRRKLPFLVYTRFVADVGKERQLLGSALFLGAFPKSREGIAEVGRRLADLMDAPLVRLAVMSDLHFDSHLVGEQATDRDNLFRHLGATLREESRRHRFDALVVAGDIAALDPVADLFAVRDTLPALAEAALGDHWRRRLFLVPGNHDVVWKDLARRERAAHPWSAYVDLCTNLFQGSPEVLAAMKAWDPDQRRLRPHSDGTSLCWHREDDDLKLDLVGIVSAEPEPEAIERGMVHTDTIRWVEERWSGERHRRHTRIAIAHHNLFDVLSATAAHSAQPAINASKLVSTLMQHGCDLLVTGHSHDPGIIHYAAPMPRAGRRYEVRGLSVVSPATVGSTHPAGDRPCGFLALTIWPPDGQTGRRSIEVQEFEYDGRAGTWLSPSAPLRDPAFDLVWASRTG